MKMTDKLLYRQIHPQFVQDGIVTSQAFRPIKPKTRLSVYDGSMINPKPAWQHYTNTLKNKSIGVMGVTENECELKKLKVISDPKPYKEHILIDFGNFTQNKVKSIAKALAADAKKRGWCYEAVAEHGHND